LVYASEKSEITFAGLTVGTGATENVPNELIISEPEDASPFKLAVMIAFPAPRIETIPLLSTDATVGFDDVKLKYRFDAFTAISVPFGRLKIDFNPSIG
jgi:hypothetical protein